MNTLTKIVLASLMAGIVSMPCYADTVTKTTTTVTTIRTDAPIYMGPVTNIVELKELTLEDFQQFGATKPSAAFQQFQEYQAELKQPKPNPTLVPYKMLIADRDLMIADFEGFHVSPELAQARYQEYLRMNPVAVNGRNARYVFVYHTPV